MECAEPMKRRSCRAGAKPWAAESTDLFACKLMMANSASLRNIFEHQVVICRRSTRHSLKVNLCKQSWSLRVKKGEAGLLGLRLPSLSARPSLVNPPDRENQIRCNALLIHAPVCSHFTCAGQQLNRILLAHDDNLDLGKLVSEHACGLQAARARHAYIEQNHVRPNPPDSGEGFQTVCRFAADVPIHLRCKQPDECASHRFIVVGDQDSHTPGGC